MSASLGHDREACAACRRERVIFHPAQGYNPAPQTAAGGRSPVSSPAASAFHNENCRLHREVRALTRRLGVVVRLHTLDTVLDCCRSCRHPWPCASYLIASGGVE